MSTPCARPARAARPRPLTVQGRCLLDGQSVTSGIPMFDKDPPAATVSQVAMLARWPLPGILNQAPVQARVSKGSQPRGDSHRRWRRSTPTMASPFRQ
jgi:hypothetical protein